jgi:hypothetical protein
VQNLGIKDKNGVGSIRAKSVKKKVLEEIYQSSDKKRNKDKLQAIESP